MGGKAEAGARKAEGRMAGSGKAERLDGEGECGGESCPVPEQPEDRQEKGDPGETVADEAGSFRPP